MNKYKVRNCTLHMIFRRVARKFGGLVLNVCFRNIDGFIWRYGIIIYTHGINFGSRSVDHQIKFPAEILRLPDDTSETLFLLAADIIALSLASTILHIYSVPADLQWLFCYSFTT